jgi:hypothetical protein
MKPSQSFETCELCLIRLCGIVVKVPVNRARGSLFDSRRGPPTLVSINDELIEKRSSSFGLEN